MSRDNDAAFYSAIPAFNDFGRLMEPSLYRPLPEGWLIGMADIVRSTDAIADRPFTRPSTASAIERLLIRAADAGTVRYGLHRQDAALMTCFSLPQAQAGHFHFIDGARGGYASAAVALKAAMT